MRPNADRDSTGKPTLLTVSDPWDILMSDLLPMREHELELGAYTYLAEEKLGLHSGL